MGLGKGKGPYRVMVISKSGDNPVEIQRCESARNAASIADACIRGDNLAAWVLDATKAEGDQVIHRGHL